MTLSDGELISCMDEKKIKSSSKMRVPMDDIGSTGDSCSMSNTSLETNTVIDHPINSKVESDLTQSHHDLESTGTNTKKRKKKNKKKKKKVSENYQNTQIDVQGDTSSIKDEDGPIETILCRDSRVDTDEMRDTEIAPGSGLTKSKRKKLKKKSNASVINDSADCPPADLEPANTVDTDEKTDSKVTPNLGLMKSQKKKKKNKKKGNAVMIDDNVHASHAELELVNAVETDEKADSEMAPSSELQRKKKRRKQNPDASVANDGAQVPVVESELISTVDIDEKEDSKIVPDSGLAKSQSKRMSEEEKVNASLIDDNAQVPLAESELITTVDTDEKSDSKIAPESGSKKSRKKKKQKLTASVSDDNVHVPLAELELIKMDENASISEQRINSSGGPSASLVKMHDNNGEDGLLSAEKENIQTHQKKSKLKNCRKRKNSSDSEENAEPDMVAGQTSSDTNKVHASEIPENEVERVQAGDNATAVKIVENVSTEVVSFNCPTGDVACISNGITEMKQDANTDLHIEDNPSEVPCFSGEFSVGRPTKKLLILDVNGLLVDTLPYGHILQQADIIISRKSVFKRPFCDDFLRFCFEKFNVGVWSSRTKKNVDQVIDFLLGDSRHKLLFVWHQSHCTDTGYTTVENSNKPLLLKELRKLWDKIDCRLPWNKGDYDESNTLLLDDSPYKALRNPPNTAIFPRTYQYKDAGDCSLGPGGDLRVYLERCADAENVQDFIARNPFGQRAITESNPSWGFYQKFLNVSADVAGGSGNTW